MFFRRVKTPRALRKILIKSGIILEKPSIHDLSKSEKLASILKEVVKIHKHISPKKIAKKILDSNAKNRFALYRSWSEQPLEEVISNDLEKFLEAKILALKTALEAESYIFPYCEGPMKLSVHQFLEQTLEQLATESSFKVRNHSFNSHYPTNQRPKNHRLRHTSRDGRTS